MSAHDWKKASWRIEPVGSRVTCSPPPTDTDEDFLVLDQFGGVISHLESQGFEQEGLPEFYTGKEAGQFLSLRRGNTNVIVTPYAEFFNRFMSATELARRFNLMAKTDRIALFQAVLYGVEAHNLEA